MLPNFLSERPPEVRNGYVFDHTDPSGLESAMHRAIGLWNHHPDELQQLMRQGMAYDFSWNRPGHDYVSVYEWVRHK